MIDLIRLRVFIHAAESLNFSQAAKELHVTQPTVSHHIKALEKDLDRKLFDRSGGNIHLTEAGRLLLPWARKLVRESYELQEMMASIHERIAGHLRIACSTTTGKYILPQFAARFHDIHPGVKVSIMSCTLPNVVPRLLEEEANIGVVSYDACGGALECQEFFLDHVILIAPSVNPWLSGVEIEPADLIQVPFILREPTSGTRKVMLAELGKHDISLDDMNIVLEVGNAEAIVKAVEAGFGISFVSRLAAEWALSNKSVIKVPVTGVDLRRKVYMVRKHMQVPNRALEAFWGFVHDPINADILRMAEK
jgi:DNA-binding transcriptional LysR family regulator